MTEQELKRREVLDAKMRQQISSRRRTLDDIYSNDIIYRKAKVKEIFETDPDLKEALGVNDILPLNTYKDKDNPTEEEKKKRGEILYHNRETGRDQIVPWIKVNGIQTDVKNYVLFDILDERQDY